MIQHIPFTPVDETLKLKTAPALHKNAKGICPFTETPSVNHQQVSVTSEKSAQELFSLFTANIITANTNFVR
jgi:hypothetical protein